MFGLIRAGINLLRPVVAGIASAVGITGLPTSSTPQQPEPPRDRVEISSEARRPEEARQTIPNFNAWN